MASNIFQRWASRKLAVKKENEASNQLDSLNVDENFSAYSSTNSPSAEQNRVEGEPLEEQEGLDTETQIQVDTANTEGSTLSESSLAANDEGTGDGLPSFSDVASVSFDSGAAAFLKEGVEKSVKKAALSKLFHSDEFNYISDMDDHTEDFSNIPKLDTSVVKQLRSWVNEVADKVEELTDAAGMDVNTGLAHDDLAAVTNANDSNRLDSATSQTEQSRDDETLSEELSKASSEEEVEASAPTEIPTDLVESNDVDSLLEAKSTDVVTKPALNDEKTSQLNQIESHKKV